MSRAKEEKLIYVEGGLFPMDPLEDDDNELYKKQANSILNQRNEQTPVQNSATRKQSEPLFKFLTDEQIKEKNNRLKIRPNANRSRTVEASRSNESSRTSLSPTQSKPVRMDTPRHTTLFTNQFAPCSYLTFQFDETLEEQQAKLDQAEQTMELTKVTNDFEEVITKLEAAINCEGDEKLAKIPLVDEQVDNASPKFQQARSDIQTIQKFFLKNKQEGFQSLQESDEKQGTFVEVFNKTM